MVKITSGIPILFAALPWMAGTATQMTSPYAAACLSCSVIAPKKHKVKNYSF